MPRPSFIITWKEKVKLVLRWWVSVVTFLISFLPSAHCVHKACNVRITCLTWWRSLLYNFCSCFRKRLQDYPIWAFTWVSIECRANYQLYARLFSNCWEMCMLKAANHVQLLSILYKCLKNMKLYLLKSKDNRLVSQLNKPAEPIGGCHWCCLLSRKWHH